MTRLLALSLACLLALTSAARATTVIPPTFDAMVSTASTIFVGDVVDVRAAWIQTPRGRAIKTFVTFSVEDTWKGSLGRQTQLEFLGGEIGEMKLEVAEMPTFTVGQRAVLFVSSEVRTISPLVGFYYGRLHVERDASGVDHIRANDGRSIANLAEVTARRADPLLALSPMRLTDLGAEVRRRVLAGRAQ
jgi:hypothetical protein